MDSSLSKKTSEKKPGVNTTSRYSGKKRATMKKGNFHKKVKIKDAPNLLAVVTAKPEIKKMATAGVEAREKKIEEKKRKISGRTVVSKPSPKQRTCAWTSVLSPGAPPLTTEDLKPSTRVINKAGSRNMGTWKNAYLDILSPQSGKQKVVAKQDLAGNKIPSPKKKSRKPPSKPALPPIEPLDDQPEPMMKKKPAFGIKQSPPKPPLPPIGSLDDDVEPIEKSKEDIGLKSSVFIDEESKTTLSSKTEYESSLGDIPKVEESSLPLRPKHPRPVTPPPESKAEIKQVTPEQSPSSSPKDESFGEKNKPCASEPVKSCVDQILLEPKSSYVPQEDEPHKEKEDFQRSGPAVAQEDLDEYVDVESDEESGIEAVEKSQKLDEPEESRVEGESGQKLDEPEHIVPPEQQKMKRQLVLEFALPTEDGNVPERGLEVPVDVQSIDDMSSVGSWPSIESNDSYDTMMNKMMQRWMDIHGDEEDDQRTMYNNDVDLEDNVLDHVALACPNLQEAMIQFEDMTGIKPTIVGPLTGIGAKTAHVGLDNNRYIEILAPDDENPGPLGDELMNLQPGTLTPYHYSIRSSEVTRLIEGYVYDVLGWDPDHIAMVQALPDKSIRQWDMLTMYGHDVGGVAPCYVKWKNPALHPTASIALKATLSTCTVRAPKNHDVHKLITGVDGINVVYGEPLLEVTISTPKGPLTFSANYPNGLVFPGYDDEHYISDMPDLLPVSGEQSIDHDWADVGYDSDTND